MFSGIDAADLGAARVKLDADHAGFTGGINKATGGLKSFALAAPAILKPVGIALLGLTAGVVAAAAAITTISVQGVKEYGKFGHEMANVSTMIRTDVERNTQALSAGVRQMALDMPHNTSILSEALYDVLSASVPLSESLYTLESSGKAAVAGVSDVKTAANLATGTINALGLEFADVDKVFDTAFATVRSGKVTFSELAGSMGQVLPSANKMGSSIQEVYGSIAFLTQNAFSADMASVSLARALDALGEKSDELENIGVKVFGEEGQYVGLVSVMEQLAGVIVGMTDAAKVKIFDELGFDKRAARAIITMTENLDQFKRVVGEVGDSAGAAGEAYKKLENTLVNKWNVLKNSFTELKLSIGEGLQEAAGSALDSIKQFVDSTSKLISTGGGLTGLWQDHRNVVIALIGDLAQTGLTLVGKFASGTGEILRASALPAWEWYWQEWTEGWRTAALEATNWLQRIYKWDDPELDEKINARNQRFAEDQNERYDVFVARQKVITEAALADITTTIADMATAPGEALQKATGAIQNTTEQIAKTIETSEVKVQATVKDSQDKQTEITEAGSKARGFVRNTELESHLHDYQKSFAKEEAEIKKRGEAFRELERQELEDAKNFLAEWVYTERQAMYKVEEDFTIRINALHEKDQQRTEKAMQQHAEQQQAEIDATETFFGKWEKGQNKRADKKEKIDKRMYENTLRFHASELNSLDAQTTLLNMEYAEQYAFAEEFGGDLIALEEWRNKELRQLQADHWLGYVDNTADGINTLSETYYGIRGLFNDILGDEDDFHDTWLSNMATWIDKQATLLHNLSTLWNDVSGIIHKINDLLGGGSGGSGGGSVLGTLLGSGGSGGGSGMGSILGTGAGAGGGAGIWGTLRSIGGKAKAGASSAAGAVGGANWGAIASTAAGIAAPIAAAAIYYKAFKEPAMLGIDKLFGTNLSNTNRSDKGYDWTQSITNRKEPASNYKTATSQRNTTMESMWQSFINPTGTKQGLYGSANSLSNKVFDKAGTRAVNQRYDQQMQSATRLGLTSVDIDDLKAYGNLLDLISGGQMSVAKKTELMNSMMVKMVTTQDKATSATNFLYDALAGHSLTTGLDEVNDRMPTTTEMMWLATQAIVGFTDAVGVGNTALEWFNASMIQDVMNSYSKTGSDPRTFFQDYAPEVTKNGEYGWISHEFGADQNLRLLPGADVTQLNPDTLRSGALGEYGHSNYGRWEPDWNEFFDAHGLGQNWKQETHTPTGLKFGRLTSMLNTQSRGEYDKWFGNGGTYDMGMGGQTAPVPNNSATEAQLSQLLTAIQNQQERPIALNVQGNGNFNSFIEEIFRQAKLMGYT